MGVAAYRQTIVETESPRQIERRVFVSVTSSLETFQLKYDQSSDSAERLDILANGLRERLWQNERVWMALKADLLESSNLLSKELRAGLISLALWVERHTANVLAGKAEVKPLLDINRSIVNGLDGNQKNLKELN
jgi:flagellar protein FlaF